MKHIIHALHEYAGRMRTVSRLVSTSFIIMLYAMMMPTISYAQMSSPRPAPQKEVEKPTYGYRIAMVGDSLSSGYRLGTQHSFPVRLQERLHRMGYRYIGVENFTGRTMTTERVYKKMLSRVLEYEPTMVIVELGATDVLRNRDTMQIRHYLNKLMKELSQRDMKIILVGIPLVRNHGEDYAKKFYAIYHDLAKYYQIPFYHNFLDGVLGYEELVIKDNIHPNSEGIIIMAQRFSDFLAPYLPQPLAVP